MKLAAWARCLQEPPLFRPSGPKKSQSTSSFQVIFDFWTFQKSFLKKKKKTPRIFGPFRSPSSKKKNSKHPTPNRSFVSQIPSPGRIVASELSEGGFSTRPSWRAKRKVLRSESLERLGGWLGGWLVGSLVGWLGGWLVGWLVGSLVGWLGGWLVGWLVF